MDTTLLFEFSIDRENKTINVKREFSAGREKVWAAWTQSELLDKWWAPKPWKCETTSMDFKVGGRWLYTMVGPKGEKQYSLADYESIDPQKSFSEYDAFCDENGNIDTNMPRSNWTVTFTAKGEDKTLVHIDIFHEKPGDIDKYLETGFKEGFAMGLNNLEELLESEN